MIDLYDLSYQYEIGNRRFPVLRHINARFTPGRLTMLIGSSGCGKTTLLCLLAGLLRCRQGRINVFGKTISEANDAWFADYRAHTVGMIFQQSHFIPGMNVLENVAAAAVISDRISWAEASARAEKILQKFDFAKYASQRCELLSCGEQQRVSVCRALVRNTKLLLCDEPTAALDRDNGVFLMEHLKKMALSSERVVLVVTHDRYLLKYADEIWEMQDGGLAIHAQ